jgi:hypothetical protein
MQGLQRSGGKSYLYAVHYDSGDRYRCYLGPVYGYVHAGTTHPFISLRSYEAGEVDLRGRIDSSIVHLVQRRITTEGAD